MTARVFVDTNVLVYARDATEAAKQKRALSWMERLWRTRAGRVSFPILNEYYVTVTARLRPGLDVATARADVRALFAWKPVTVDGVTLERAWLLADKHRLPWWDALVVAAAQSAGCRYCSPRTSTRGRRRGASRWSVPSARHRNPSGGDRARQAVRAPPECQGVEEIGQGDEHGLRHQARDEQPTTGRYWGTAKPSGAP